MTDLNKIGVGTQFERSHQLYEIVEVEQVGESTRYRYKRQLHDGNWSAGTNVIYQLPFNQLVGSGVVILSIKAIVPEPEGKLGGGSFDSELVIVDGEEING